MSVLISINNLTKWFGPILAVDDVSFTVERGEVLGFLGPNGAGKSTTMKMITGFIAPTSGTAEVCGHDVEDEPVEAKRTIGYLPEGAPAYPDMTPATFLNFVAGIRGFDGAERRTRIDLAVKRVDLSGVLNQPIDTLSKGFKRRVGLAQALLHDPEVLILDEPTDGLDPNQKHEVRALIRDLARDKAIIISTHILEEVDALCTRALIICQGRIVADGTPAMLEARSRYHLAVSIVARLDRLPELATGLGKLPCSSGVEQIAGSNGVGQVIVFPRAGAPILDEVSRYIKERAVPIEEIRVERGRLDEVFRAATTGRT
jgi:ABC-2 type transport system ATP-binding protein